MQVGHQRPHTTVQSAVAANHDIYLYNSDQTLVYTCIIPNLLYRQTSSGMSNTVQHYNCQADNTLQLVG